MPTTIPILMYHHVAPVPPGLRALRGLYVTPGAFGRQMKLLQMSGYRGVSMADAIPYLRGEASGRVAVITLDDGYVDNIEHALPLLEKFGFTATCYMVSGHYGGYNHWDLDRAGVKAALMDQKQLRQWRARGMEVGAHTRSHVHLTRCTDDELQEQIAGSKVDLEQTLGCAVTQFCYPYGDTDQRVTAAVRDAGYEAATTTRRGRARPGGDLLELPRVPVSNRSHLMQFALKLFSGYEDRRA